jgi:hypothetical protein
MPTRKNNEPDNVDTDVEVEEPKGGFYADGPSDGPNRRSPDDEADNQADS